MSFRFDERGMAELEEQMFGAAADVAEAVAEHARAVAPVRTGEYRDSIHVERGDGEVRVVADAPHAAVVEFGTADTPAFAPLTRGQDAAVADLARILGGRLR